MCDIAALNNILARESKPLASRARNLRDRERELGEAEATLSKRARDKEHRERVRAFSFAANNKKAIGYVGLGYIDKNIKPVSVNNVKPDIYNAKAKIYPITRLLYMYVNTNNYTENAKKFVLFLLSKQGQEMVKEAGYLPL